MQATRGWIGLVATAAIVCACGGASGDASSTSRAVASEVGEDSAASVGENVGPQSATPVAESPADALPALPDDVKAEIFATMGLPLDDASGEASQLAESPTVLAQELLRQEDVASAAPHTVYLARRSDRDGFFDTEAVPVGGLVLVVDITDANKAIMRSFPGEEPETIVVDRIIVVADSAGRFLASGESGFTTPN